MPKRLLPILVLGILTGSGLSTLGSAQTGPTGLQPPSQLQTQIPPQVTISPIQPSSAPTSGLPANILTPATTTQFGPSPGVQTRSIFNSAGNGLPGMPGGPPVNTPAGVQDPSARYMTPPVIGPLFCDPALDLLC